MLPRTHSRNPKPTPTHTLPPLPTASSARTHTFTPTPPNDNRWVSPLLHWYHHSRRILPWRENPLPYPVWISEIMLQQTQVDTVTDYFHRFIRIFPDIESLANADIQDVLKAWEGLGYYSRAKNLQKAAQCVLRDFSGKLPEDFHQLLSLPGIGPYTAAAISSIAFGHPIPVVNGNVLRVFSRLWGLFEDIRNSSLRDHLFLRLKAPIQDVNPSHFNQAIMELGALICRPHLPDCTHCPIHPHCFAHTREKTSQLPVKSKKAPIPHHVIVVGIIQQENRLLITRRPLDKMLGGLWEFPGGKHQEGQTYTESLQKKLQQQFHLKIRIKNACKQKVKHTFSHFQITLIGFYCELPSSPHFNQDSTESLRWVNTDELERFPFATATRKLMTSELLFQS